jgi:hypothetical protein
MTDLLILAIVILQLLDTETWSNRKPCPHIFDRFDHLIEIEIGKPYVYNNKT